MKDAIRVVVFEDNKRFLESLEFYFEGSEEVYLVESFNEANHAWAEVKRLQPDVVVMDIELPGISGIEALRKIKQEQPDTKIMMLTSFEDNHKIFAALCAGASGYVLKSSGLEATRRAILDVHAGGGFFSPSIAGKVISFFQDTRVSGQLNYVELTKMEKKVLDCMALGFSYKMIEKKLNKSYSAVHFHIKNIYKKLHVNSMTEAVVKAINNRLI